MFYSMLRNILVAAFHGSLYTDLSPGAIQSRLSLLFFAIMFVMMANQSFIPKYVYLSPSLPTLPSTLHPPNPNSLISTITSRTQCL